MTRSTRGCIRAGLLATAVTVVAVLAGCGSRHVDATPARLADSQGNATVRKVTYFAAWVDERGGVAAPRNVALADPVAAPTRASNDKRSNTRSKAGTAKAAEPATAPPSAAKPAGPQPRYEYTVELDAGGYRTLVGSRDLGIHVNDRVVVQGDSVAALAN